jgi:hypothetical protein
MVTSGWPESIDTSEDYLLWTNTIEVGYLSKTAEKPDAAVVPITHVLRRAIRKDRLLKDSLLAHFDVTIRMAKAVMQGIIPKADDLVIDPDGTRWVVKLVEVVSYGNEYRVHTIKSMKQNTAVG